MSKVIDGYLEKQNSAECRLVTNFPNGRDGNASYAAGSLQYKPAEEPPRGRGRLMPQRLTGELRWFFSNRIFDGLQPFDRNSTEPLELTLFGGSDERLGFLFNRNWRQRFPDGIGLRLLHEEDDSANLKDLILGMDSNGAGVVISLYRPEVIK
jgi:hypothetical protein